MFMKREKFHTVVCSRTIVCLLRAVPRFMRLVADLSPWRFDFDPRPVNMVYELAQGQIFRCECDSINSLYALIQLLLTQY